MLFLAVLLLIVCCANGDDTKGRLVWLGDDTQRQYLCSNPRMDHTITGYRIEECWAECRYRLNGCTYFGMDTQEHKCLFWAIDGCDEPPAPDPRYLLAKIDPYDSIHYYVKHQTDGNDDACASIGNEWAHWEHITYDALNLQHCGIYALLWGKSEYFTFKDYQNGSPQSKRCIGLFGRCDINRNGDWFKQGYFPLYRLHLQGPQHKYVWESTPAPSQSPTTSPTFNGFYGQSFDISDDGQYAFVSDPSYLSSSGRIYVKHLGTGAVVGKSITSSDENGYCGYRVHLFGSRLFTFCTMKATSSSEGQIHIFDTSNLSNMKLVAMIPSVLFFHVGRTILVTTNKNRDKFYLYDHDGEMQGTFEPALLLITAKVTDITTNDNFVMFHTAGVSHVTDVNGRYYGTIENGYRLMQSNNNKIFKMGVFTVSSKDFVGNYGYNILGYKCDTSPKFIASTSVGGNFETCRYNCALLHTNCVATTAILEISYMNNAFISKNTCVYLKECNFIENTDPFTKTYISLPDGVQGMNIGKTCLNGQLNIDPIIANRTTCLNTCLEYQYCDYFRVTNLGDSSLCVLYSSQCTPRSVIDDKEVILYSVKTSFSLRPAFGDTIVGLNELYPDESLLSTNGKYRLLFQFDGNLVIYANDGREAIWSAGSDGVCSSNGGGGVAQLRRDGNLVVYCKNGAFSWQSGGYYVEDYPYILNIDNNGNVATKTFFGYTTWQTDSYVNALWSAPNGVMLSDESISVRDPYWGTKLTLIMQMDSNLVLYNDGQPHWSTGTDVICGGNGAKAILQTDGNFVVYCSHGTVAWASNSAVGDSRGPFKLSILSGNGNIVIREQNGNTIWSRF